MEIDYSKTLPEPIPLRQAAIMEFTSGPQHFTLLCVAAEVRNELWEDGRRVDWLHCKGVQVFNAMPNESEPIKSTTYMVPADYVTRFDTGPPYKISEYKKTEDIGLFPPEHPAPTDKLGVKVLRQRVRQMQQIRKAKILRFELKVGSEGGARVGLELFRQFHPNGKTVLNKAEWRGKEPRSCGVTRVKSRSHSMGDPSPIIVDIEVAYRPQGYISYEGTTRYDGWSATAPIKKDGVLIGRDGQPLKEGEPPIYQAFDVYPDTDFNEMEFGEFVGEFDTEDVKRTTVDEVMQELIASGSFGGVTFIAPYRNRPQKKIILSDAPTGEFVDGFGTRVLNINNSTDQLEQVLMDRLESLMREFIEGKASIKSMGNNAVTYVELSDALVDCTPNAEGGDSWFDMLRFYTPIGFLEDLAKKLMSVYEIDVSIIEGKGLVLRREAKE